MTLTMNNILPGSWSAISKLCWYNWYQRWSVGRHGADPLEHAPFLNKCHCLSQLRFDFEVSIGNSRAMFQTNTPNPSYSVSILSAVCGVSVNCQHWVICDIQQRSVLHHPILFQQYNITDIHAAHQNHDSICSLCTKYCSGTWPASSAMSVVTFNCLF